MPVYTDEARTVLGDLTTVFTPPASCTIAIAQCEVCDIAWWGQTCAESTVQDNTNCWPATTEGAPQGGSPLFGWGFYSPGVECPAGHTTACTAVAGQRPQWAHQYRMEPGETFVGCCPTGFGCTNLNGQTCVMLATSLTLPTVSCHYGGSSNNFGFTTIPNPEVSSLSLFAPMIQLAHKPSDLPSTSSTPTTSAISTVHGATRSSPTTSAGPSAAAANPATSSTSTLTTGAIAGIAVGVGALFLLTLAAAILLWRRRRRHYDNLNNPHAPDHASNPSAYLDGTSSGGSDSVGEIKQFTHYYAAAAAATTGPVEMGHGHERHEAPGHGLGPAEAPGPESAHAEMFAGGVEGVKVAQGQDGSGAAAGPGAVPARGHAGNGCYPGGDAFGAAQEPVEMPTQKYT